MLDFKIKKFECSIRQYVNIYRVIIKLYVTENREGKKVGIWSFPNIPYDKIAFNIYDKTSYQFPHFDIYWDVAINSPTIIDKNEFKDSYLEEINKIIDSRNYAILNIKNADDGLCCIANFILKTFEQIEEQDGS